MDIINIVENCLSETGYKHRKEIIKYHLYSNNMYEEVIEMGVTYNMISLGESIRKNDIENFLKTLAVIMFSIEFLGQRGMSLQISFGYDYYNIVSKLNALHLISKYSPLRTSIYHAFTSISTCSVYIEDRRVSDFLNSSFCLIIPESSYPRRKDYPEFYYSKCISNILNKRRIYIESYEWNNRQKKRCKDVNNAKLLSKILPSELIKYIISYIQYKYLI